MRKSTYILGLFIALILHVTSESRAQRGDVCGYLSTVEYFKFATGDKSHFFIAKPNFSGFTVDSTTYSSDFIIAELDVIEAVVSSLQPERIKLLLGDILPKKFYQKYREDTLFVHGIIEPNLSETAGEPVYYTDTWCSPVFLGIMKNDSIEFLWKGQSTQDYRISTKDFIRLYFKATKEEEASIEIGPIPYQVLENETFNIPYQINKDYCISWFNYRNEGGPIRDDLAYATFNAGATGMAEYEYFYRNFFGDYREVGQIEVLPANTPPAPAIAAVNFNSDLNKYELSWDRQNESAQSYEIFRRDKNKVLTSLGIVPAQETNTYIDQETENGIDLFSYAIAEIIPSDSSEALIYSMRSQEHTPMLLSKEGRSSNVVELSWNPYSGTDFETISIHRSVNQGPFEIVEQVPATTRSYVEKISDYITLEYYLSTSTIHNKTNLTLRSNSVSFDLFPTNIYDEDMPLLYPNPTKDCVVLHWEKSYQLFSGLGQVVKEGTISNNQICLTDLPNGVYFLQLGESSHLRRKIVKKS